MKKYYFLLLPVLMFTLNGCFVIGSVFRLGFKMGIYSVFVIIGLLIWVIIKRGNRR